MHLTGHGTIDGRVVKCIDIDAMIEFHLGYEPDAEDAADVIALCHAFQRPIPAIYESFPET